MAIRYAKDAMTIDGIVFNPGDIVPESLYPALDAHEANMKEVPQALSNASFPAENADEEEEDEDDEETYEIEVPLGGSEADALPKPELDSTAPDKVPEAPAAPTAPAKDSKKAGK